MADITVDVNLPNPITVDVTSPTQAASTNISIPGPQGPQGPRGAGSNVNGLTPDFLYITGRDGIIVSSNNIDTIFISGNSGYFQSAVNSLTTNLNNTGSSLNNSINSLSGSFTEYTGNLDNNYATDTQLANTGSNLNTKIDNFSGTYQNFVDNLDSSYATDVQLQNTGSTLSQNINSLSGTLTGNYYLKSNPSGFITGVDLSSYLTSSNASSTYATIINLASTGSTLVSSINSLNSAFTGFTGNLDATYATDSQLVSTGSTLVSSINSLSGYINSTSSNIIFTTGNQIKSGRLIIGDDAVSIVDPNSTYTLSLQTNSPSTWLEILNNSGANKGVFFGIAGNDFQQWNFQGGDIVFFTAENVSDGLVRLTIKNDGKVGIGTSSPSEKLEVVGNIKANNLIYTTGNQIKTGHLVIGDTILDPSSPYTLSLQSNDALTLLEILNNGGSGQGAQVAMNGNEFELYNYQGGDIIFYTSENPSGGIDRLYIKNNGNIGIGTNIPSEKLEVIGNIIANNLVYNTGNQTVSGIKTFNLAPIISGNPFITGNLSLYATVANLATTGSTLNTRINDLSGYVNNQDNSISNNLNTTGSTLDIKINSLSGSSVLLYGNQSIGGVKTFRDNVYINNLYVTGTETIVNTAQINLASNYLLLNITGGAVDGGIFFVTGTGLTGVNDTGPIIGFDHSTKFKFGFSTRNSDLSTLPDIASVQDIIAYSGVADNKFSTITNLASTGSTLNTNINSLSGTLTSTYATITNLALTGSTLVTNLASTGSTLNTRINNLSGYVNSTSSNIVFTTGNQTISGDKIFKNNIVIEQTGVFSAIDLSDTDNILLSGIDIQIVSGSITLTNPPTISGNPFITGNLSLYAATINLASTGSTLNSSISSLSGTLTSTYATITNLASTGSSLYSQIENAKKLAIAYAIAL